MSRNIRQKYPQGSRPRPRIKLTNIKRRRDSDTSSPSSLNLSDDEGYSGVEDVSESDDDDEHVVAAEEEFIKADKLKIASAPARPLEEENDADEEDDGEDDDEDGIDLDDDDEDDDDSGIEWPGPDPYIFGQSDEEVTPVVERHVRFAGIPDSDSDSTSTDTDDDGKFFPDIFVDEDHLDPAFRREIDNDDNMSDSSGSYWDYHQDVPNFHSENDATPMDTPGANEPLKCGFNEDSDDELDGYETDEESVSTDEDIPEPMPSRQSRARSSSSDEDTSDSDAPIRQRATRDNKPIGVFDPATGKLIIYTPSGQNRIDVSSETFTGVDACSPIMSNSAYIMMGAMLSSNTLGDLMTMQPFGPAEAFFPCTSDEVTGDDSDMSDYYPYLDDEDDEDTLKLEDFIEFKDHPSDDDESGQEWNDAESSPSRPKTSASNADFSSAGVHPLLSHFESNSNAVGAFRRNQINQQLINSEITTQESLQFPNPYHYGHLKGIKPESMETVTTPITPVRRQKSNSLVGSTGFPDASPGSSLNRNLLQKRKATINDHTDSPHKRQRSLQDMEILQL
ncbi:hypothetical protein QBC38DRAFT_95925 [Podospora fimiseda]|uniref:Uncharacterized protein n=1 Tax=Podospora fimiseda TaxID=252190 RepID=A0AAN7BZB9_9PEZI|nr:hypothetical protein QBC38DRAFT_95925 [Podospora fimiseda]